jgi:D-amino-acid dehydrogenase
MENNKKQTVIIGGGVIGLFTAYYLQKRGIEDIIILDKSAGIEGCSFGNAGMIVPSHFIPLASPGIISKGIKWMFDSKSPFYLKPRLNLNLLRWGLAFYKNSTEKFVEKSAPRLRDLSLFSKSLYQDLHESNEFDINYHEKGLLLYCISQEAYHEELETADYASRLGLRAENLNLAEIKKLEPNLEFKGVGAVYYPGDAHLNPRLLTENLQKYLTIKGVQIISEAEITSIEYTADKIEEIKFEKNNQILSIKPKNLILAAGAWSQKIAKMLKLYLPMQAGKGYSLETDQNSKSKFSIPSILVESRVAVTPFDGNTVRFGGTMELAGLNDKINLNRVKGITEALPKFFENFAEPKIDKQKIWYGLRPCSPDGLPYIGASKTFKNFYLNTGHAMMGISLAPASGKILADIVCDEKPKIDLAGFNPERFAY